MGGMWSLSALALLAPAAQAAPELTLEQRIERARAQSEQSAQVRNLNINPVWVGPDELVIVAFGDAGRRYELVNAATKARTRLWDEDAVAKALGEAVKQQISGSRLTVTVTGLDADNVLFTYQERRWRWDRKEGRLSEAQPAGRQGGQGRDFGRSPDGAWRVATTGFNLTLEGPGDAKIEATTGGTDPRPFVFHGWSPDSSRFVYSRLTKGPRPKMFYIRSVPEEGFRPVVNEQMYELPGDATDSYELFIYDLASRSAKPVQAMPIGFWGAPQLDWSRDGKSFRYVQTHRGFQRLTLWEVDSATAAGKMLVDETTAISNLPGETFYQRMPDGGFLWSSLNRTGWLRAYRFGPQGGEPVGLTPDGWTVRERPLVEPDREIIFQASGFDPKRDPYLISWFSAPLSGGPAKNLTPEDGDHNVVWSPTRKWLVSSYSRVDAAPRHVLRSRSGELVMNLAEADISRWNRPMPEVFTAKARDGKTDIWGVIIRPKGFVKGAKYPVVEYVYSGPHGSHTPKRFMATSRMMALADAGFIVVQADGLGTNNRGKAFRAVSYKNLGDGGFPDRIGWMKEAAKSRPEMDLAQGVGIFGYSAGGYDAGRALVAFNDFYKFAVSLCGNHDHRTDKLWWNECWMGFPIGPHYAEQSNIENAAKVQGKLLLVAGELDDNVNAHAGTLRFVDALVKADKQFEMMYMPGRNHNLGGWYIDRAIYSFFVRHMKPGPLAP